MPDSVSDPSQRSLFSQEPPRDAFTQFSEAYHAFEDAFRKFNRNKQDRHGGLYGRPVRSIRYFKAFKFYAELAKVFSGEWYDP